jgi:hypothetical protein
MEVRLIVSGTSRKFWYRDGITDSDLVEFTGAYPGGNDKSVQFNDGGVFGGVPDFTFDKSTSTLKTSNLSGSLTTLSDGTSYLVAGSGIQITTGSNGSVTITSYVTGTSGGTITSVSAGLGLVGGGTSGSVTLAIDDSIVATLSGATFTGPVLFNGGLSGSLTHLSDGSSFLIAGDNITITTGSTGAITISSTSPTGSAGTITEIIAGLGLVGGGTSGSVTLAVNDSVVATISGSTFTGPVNFNAGLSGSLTRLVDGSPYLLAGTNVTVNNNPNGSITISSTVAGTNTVNLVKWMEVPLGDIDGMNMVYTLESTPNPPGSLMLYVNGVLQNGYGGDFLLGGDSIVMNYAPMGGSNILATYMYQIVLPTGPSVSWMETPSGITDGTNITFTLAHSPDPISSLMFYVNGILQKQGEFSDYVLTDNVVTMNYIPQVGSIITATYAYKITLPNVGSDINWMEIPAGDVDGINYTFTLDNDPLPPDALMFYVNGVLQRQGPFYDYTFSMGDTITMNYIPYSGSNIAVTYPYDASLITGDRPKYYANVISYIPANIDVSFSDGNLDAALPNMSSNNFLNDYDLYMNGALLRPGVSYFSINDYYPGSDLSLGKIRFKFDLNEGDSLCLIPVISN